MLTETEFARLIVSWKNQFGEEIRGRMCVPIQGRTEMYKSLIKTLIETHGYAEDDLMGKTYRMVIEASINPNSEKVGKWRELATEDWMVAIDIFFPKQFLVHDPNTETKIVAPKREEPIVEPVVLVDKGPMALSQEEFEDLILNSKKEYDKEFLADMAATPQQDLTQKQLERLEKIRKRAANLNKIKSSQPQETHEEEDPRLANYNPVDPSLFEGLPPVNDPVDEGFLELLRKVKDE